MSNRFEDNSELFVVRAFEFIETSSEFGVRCEHLAQFYECRMISMLTETARLLGKTLESIATPCSVKAIGG